MKCCINLFKFEIQNKVKFCVYISPIFSCPVTNLFLGFTQILVLMKKMCDENLRKKQRKKDENNGRFMHKS